MAKNTYSFLKESGFIPEQELTVRKILATSELGKRYHLNISGDKRSSLFQIDGYIISDSKRCDKLVLVEKAEEDWAEIFVELKGIDVASGIEQLKACLDNQIFRHITNKELRARIIAQSFPSNKSNPLMEKAKIEFRQKYHCDLRGMKNGQQDSI
jgi:hypothetical protein